METATARTAATIDKLGFSRLDHLRDARRVFDRFLLEALGDTKPPSKHLKVALTAADQKHLGVRSGFIVKLEVVTKP